MTNQIVPVDDSIDEFRSGAMMLLSPTSQRVYQQTYDAWVDWCHQSQLSPLAFKNVMKFLASSPDTIATRRRKLSAMRTLLEVAAIIDAQYEPIYRLLKRAKPPKTNLSKSERDRIALNPTQVQKMLDAWYGDTNQSKRNRLLIALLFIAALRRSEAAVLKWQDVDLDNSVIYVRDGKGDKSDDVGLSGSLIIRLFKEWQVICTGREYVFPRIYSSGKLGDDKPMSGDAIYNVVIETANLSGIDVKVRPHTARRTYITEALATGTPLADVKAQARHESESTTLRYARPVAASERAKKSKLRYGD